MNIVETVKAAVEFDINEGLTQTEVAAKYNLTQQAINMLLHGKKKYECLALATFAKMFPDAELILNKRILGNDIQAVYPVKSTTLEMHLAELPVTTFSHFDRAMLEEWAKLDQQDKCRVMGFMAQLELEKKPAAATTA